MNPKSCQILFYSLHRLAVNFSFAYKLRLPLLLPTVFGYNKYLVDTNSFRFNRQIEYIISFAFYLKLAHVETLKA